MRGPFGSVIISNISSHKEKRVGALTDDELKRALTEGMSGPASGDRRQPASASNTSRARSRSAGASCPAQWPTPSNVHWLTIGIIAIARDAMSL